MTFEMVAKRIRTRAHLIAELLRSTCAAPTHQESRKEGSLWQNNIYTIYEILNSPNWEICLPGRRYRDVLLVVVVPGDDG